LYAITIKWLTLPPETSVNPESDESGLIEIAQGSGADLFHTRFGV